ncbi:MAG: hypothetical protein ACREIC_21410, partial [Limisphaerales bacterium]
HKEDANMKRSENFQKERLIEPWKKFLRSAEHRATKKRVPFALSFEWVRKHWTGRCELTGLEFILGQRGAGPKAFSPSIDRIKPELGYVDDNCRFVLWAVNAFKAEGDDEQMLRLARALLSYSSPPK